jgi:hypothetical protein
MTQHDGLTKYQVRRADGQVEAGADYFVMRLDKGNPHALAAISAYAESVEKELPSLASTLRDKVRRYKRGAVVDLGGEESGSLSGQSESISAG